jgi:hypothetical protein
MKKELSTLYFQIVSTSPKPETTMIFHSRQRRKNPWNNPSTSNDPKSLRPLIEPEQSKARADLKARNHDKRPALRTSLQSHQESSNFQKNFQVTGKRTSRQPVPGARLDQNKKKKGKKSFLHNSLTILKAHLHEYETKSRKNKEKISSHKDWVTWTKTWKSRKE